MSNHEMQSKINDLRELRRMADELSAEINSIQDEIKAHMTAIDADELTGADYKVTWKTVTSSRLDAAALRKADALNRRLKFSSPTNCADIGLFITE